MITTYTCGVLRKHGSKLKNVRYMDLQAVLNQGQTYQQAEIYKGTCP